MANKSLAHPTRNGILNHFEVLGVTDLDQEATITRVFRLTSLRTHPLNR